MRLTPSSSFCILLCILTTHLHAQWNINPTQANTRVVTATANQDRQHLVTDGNGGCIVAWEDYRGGNDPDIYFDFINADGNASWSVPGSFSGVKLCTTNKPRSINRIIPAETGGFFIIWDELNGLYYDVLAQKVSATGQIQWATNGVVVCAAANDQYSADIVPDGTGGIIATWLDLRNDPGNANATQTFAQRINAAGTAVWATNGILLSNTISKPIGIVSDNNEGAIVGYMDARNSLVNGSGGYTNFDIYAQRLNNMGEAQWTVNGVAVCTQLGNQVRETIKAGGAMVSDDLGGAILCWSDYRNDPNNGLSFPYRADYFAQRITAGGLALWPTGGVQICTGTNADLYNTLAVTDNEGGILAAWYDLRAAPQSAIYVQRVDASGAKLYTNNGLPVVSGQNHIVNYDIAADGIGNAVVAYDNDADKIFSYRFLVATGAPVFGGSIPICTRAEASVSPAVAADPNGDVFFAWQDYRNNAAETDIYAMRQTNGALLPLRFVSFSGFNNQGTNQLEWKTTALESTQSFMIYKSMDGMQFEKIATVQRNRADEVHAYADSLQHQHPVYYYRIGWKNEQGKLSYSHTITIRSKASFSIVNRLAPNPATHATQLTTQANADNRATITLYTATMQPVWQQETQFRKGMNSLSISLQPLRTGVYYLAITTTQGTEVLKGIKQ